jgi:hypothetical protein
MAANVTTFNIRPANAGDAQAIAAFMISPASSSQPTGATYRCDATKSKPTGRYEKTPCTGGAEGGMLGSNVGASLEVPSCL